MCCAVGPLLGEHSIMKTFAYVFTAGLVLAAAVPAFAQTTPPRDTGSMAIPAPAPGSGNTTAVTGQRSPTDTGSMAYPAPLPQGNLGTTTTTGPNRPTDVGNMTAPTQGLPATK